jgi:hypothetical protein
MVKVS